MMILVNLIHGGNSKARSVRIAPLLLTLLASASALAGVDKNVSEVCKTSTDAAFRAKYCTAAKDLKHGYNANRATSAVWTGVSVACGAACGKATGGTVCTVASVGGSAGEGLITKKFSDSLMSEGMKWGGDAMNAKSGEDATAAPSEGKVNTDACKTAGTSALKAYEKHSNAKQNEKSIHDLKDQTNGMNAPTQDTLAYGGEAIAGAGANTSAATAGSDPCNDRAIATALGAIRCAAKSDPSLPAYAKSEEFLRDLQKATGKSPDAFFAGFESPAKSIFDSPTMNNLSESQQRGLADSLSAMEGYSDQKAAKLAATKSGSTEGYTGGGASPSGAVDNETGFDVNGILAGVLGQMGGKDETGSATGAGGNGEVGRGPANDMAVAENRKVSIFDRVQWRYGAVSARGLLGVQ